MRATALLLALVIGCAPTIDGPVERQRATDDADARRVERQLAALPHALRADVTLHRSVVDPFTLQRTPASAAVLVIVDARADRTAVAEHAGSLVHGVAPDVAAPSIVVEVGTSPPAAASRSMTGLAALLAAIAALAGAIAWRERWRVTADRSRVTA